MNTDNINLDRTQKTDKECHLCGQTFRIDELGIASHYNKNLWGGIDYDQDMQHIPYEL
jgi:hypothetical protein